MAYRLTISSSRGEKVTEHHSKRQGTLPKSADASLVGNNIHIYEPDKTHQEMLNEWFKPIIEEYNKGKSPSKRMPEDYYTRLLLGKDVKKSKNGQVAPIESFVYQLGSAETCGICDTTFDAKKWRNLRDTQGVEAASAYVQEHLNTHPKIETVKKILMDFADVLMDGKTYPNFIPCNICLHMDEPAGTPHLDVCGFYIKTNATRGMKTQVAFNQACEEMGCDGSLTGTRLGDLEEMYSSRIEEIAKGYGIEREFKNEHKKRRPVAQYRIEQEKETEEMKLTEVKRRLEVARTVEEEQKERLSELHEESAQLEKKLVKQKQKEAKAKERAKKAKAKAEQCEERAEQAEARLEQARATLQDVRDDITELREVEKIVEEEVEEKKRDAAIWQKRINDLKAYFEKLKEKVEHYEKRAHKYATALMQMQFVPELYKHPIQEFKKWIRFRAANGNLEHKEEAKAAASVIDELENRFYDECGQDVNHALIKYVKDNPLTAPQEMKKAASQPPATTRDITFIKSGDGGTYVTR